MATINARMRQRRRTAAQWTTENPVLAQAEFGVESDTGRIKVGDGATAWNSLGYAAALPDEVVLLDGAQTVTGAKTFDTSPVVPNPAAGDTSAVSKAEASDIATSAAASAVGALPASVLLDGDQTKTGTLTFAASPVVPNPAAVDTSAVSRQEAASTAAFLAQAAVDALPEIASSDPAKMPITTNGTTTLDVERLAPEVGYLTADSAAVNNSTTLVDVTGLAVPVAANAVYLIEGFLAYSSNAAADAKFGWTVPTGATGKWNPLAINATTAGTASSVNVASRLWTENLPAGATDGGLLTCHVKGLLVTGATAGVLQAQFAQNTAAAVDTTVLAHSWVSALRVG